jgi:hypothetical protein
MTKVAMMLEQIRADRLGVTAAAADRVAVSGATRTGNSGADDSATRSAAVEERPATYSPRGDVDPTWFRRQPASGLGFAFWHRFRVHVRQLLTVHPSH